MRFWVGFRPKWANVLAAQVFTVAWRPHRSMDRARFTFGPDRNWILDWAKFMFWVNSLMKFVKAFSFIVF
jgi:hypothetical protein